jgi:hypothetical protein
MKYYIGIDPGTKGAICVWGGCDIVDTLKLSTATDKDIIDFISKYADDTVFAVIEKVGVMPRQWLSRNVQVWTRLWGVRDGSHGVKHPS